MRLQEVYYRYQIMPQLSEHMRRVAGVGIKVLDGWTGEIDHDLVIRILLLHDMGNLVKFDLDLNLIPIDDLDMWKGIQREWWEKYGTNAHEATMKIVNELGEGAVAKIIEEENLGYFSGDAESILSASWPAKILAYADMRVTPGGVVPLAERIADLHSRYGGEIAWYGFLYELEKDIKRMTTTDLDAITENSVTPGMDDLLSYPL